MSTEWGLYCLDCKEESGTSEFYGIAGEESLIELLRIWPAIKEIEKNVIYWKVTHDYHGEYHPKIAFLYSHDGHKIEVRDEYGRKSQIIETSQEETCRQEKESS